MEILVESVGSTDKLKLNMKIAQGKNNVTTTPGWGKAVEEFKIKEDDIWLMNFGKSSVDNDLNLLMIRVSRG